MGQSPTINILVAEDDETSRELLKMLLVKEGYVVWLAENGQQALDLIEREPDVILLDWMMPQVSGLDVLKAIRAKGGFRYVIMVTALSSPDKISEAMAAGANDFVVKPFDPDILLMAVNSGVVWVNFKKLLAHRLQDVGVKLDEIQKSLDAGN
jgi:DNA-binding response OmpR family regulator